MKVLEIDIDQIDQNENSRTVYKTNDLSELMLSMKENGLLEPVGVRKDGARYDMVFGNRRLIAAKKLGWLTIPAHLLDIEDDNHRDIVNLVENIKRQNTTLQEEGRVMQNLKDNGLTVQEIASRIGISKNRVELALDIVNEIPKGFQKKIINKHGRSRKEGTISATMAFRVNNLRKQHRLKKEDTVQLLEYAQKADASTTQVGAIAPLLSAGMSMNKAIKKAYSLKSIDLRLIADGALIKRLEKKYNKSILDILETQVQKNPDLCTFKRSFVGGWQNEDRKRHFKKLGLSAKDEQS